MARNIKTVIILFAVAVLFGLNHAIGNEIACHKPTKQQSPAKILAPPPSQPIDPFVLTAIGTRAAEALLDPSISDLTVAQFDYGVVSNPSTLLFLRSERARKISERELRPMAPRLMPSSTDHPVILDSPTVQPESRLVYFKDRFFSNAFFVRNRENESGPIDWASFNRNQPWISWDKNKQNYIVQYGHAGRELLELISGNSVTLYRGTFPQEVAFLELLMKISKRAHTAEDLKDFQKYLAPESHLHSAIQEELHPGPPSKNLRKKLMAAFMMDLNLVKYGSSLFMTANRETAEAFSKGSLLTFQVSKAQLQKLYERSELYVGIEYDLEFAFIGENSFQLLTDSFVSSETHRPTGNIWKNRDHHLWRNPEDHLPSQLNRGK